MSSIAFHWRHWRRYWSIPVLSLFLFVITIVGVLAMDLLIGVALGMAAKLAIQVMRDS